MDFQVEPWLVLLKTPNKLSVLFAAIAYMVSGLEGASARLVRAINDVAGNPLVRGCQVLPPSCERQIPFFDPLSSMVAKITPSVVAWKTTELHQYLLGD